MTNSNNNTQKSLFMSELKATLRSIAIIIGTLIGFILALVFLSPKAFYTWVPESYSIRIILLIVWALLLVAIVFGMFRIFKRKTIINVFICSVMLVTLLFGFIFYTMFWLM